MQSEVGKMSVSQAETYAWFMDKYPQGEEAMDFRFQCLRMDIATMMDSIVYAIFKAAEGKSKAKQPKRRKFSDFQIFKRFFEKAKPNDFTTMSPEAINKRMRAIGIHMGSKMKDAG